MALEEFLESEVAIAVAATAALSSSRVRRVLRRGAVYGLAGVLRAGDAIGAVARDAGRGPRQPGAPAPGGAQGATPEATPGMAAGAGAVAAVRRGTVMGLARVLQAGDTVASTARTIGHDIQQAAAGVAEDARAQANTGPQRGADAPATPPAVGAPQGAAPITQEQSRE
jgi:hypothetical protein